MSTKAHIKLNSSVEIYEETSEPQRENGKWIGDNIYFLSDPEYIGSVRLNPKSGNLIAIKGGTQTAKNLILARE